MTQPARPTRRQARVDRQIAKQLSKDGNKVRLVQQVAESTNPRLENPETSPRLTPRVEQNPSVLLRQKMTWCTTIKDVEGSWSWGEPRQWTEDEFTRYIKTTLDSLSCLTWIEIGQMHTGGLARHHVQEVDTLIQEAQDRWIELEHDVELAFRFRLAGSQRAWGYRIGSHFRMIWYDRQHSLYPVEKSNT